MIYVKRTALPSSPRVASASKVNAFSWVWDINGRVDDKRACTQSFLWRTLKLSHGQSSEEILLCYSAAACKDRAAGSIASGIISVIYHITFVCCQFPPGVELTGDIRVREDVVAAISGRFGRRLGKDVVGDCVDACSKHCKRQRVVYKNALVSF